MDINSFMKDKSKGPERLDKGDRVIVRRVGQCLVTDVDHRRRQINVVAALDGHHWKADHADVTRVISKGPRRAC